MDARGARRPASRPAFPEVPPETRAEQVTDPHIGKDGFLDLFGRPAARIVVRVRAAHAISACRRR